jgi:hypothetical protein
MSREIGDHMFNRLFPDTDDVRAPINRPPSASDTSEKQEGYEYKTVKVPGAKSSPRRHARALTDWSTKGWEVVNVQPRGILQFGTKDTVTLRRTR